MCLGLLADCPVEEDLDDAESGDPDNESEDPAAESQADDVEDGENGMFVRELAHEVPTDCSIESEDEDGK